MYLPRPLLSHLYLSLQRTHHPLSAPVLLLVALDPDALCACRILTTLLKRDFIPHKIVPVSGYGDLAAAGEALVRPMRTGDGGSGGVAVCLGVGGLVDLGEVLGMGNDGGEGGDGEGMGGVEVWVVDARRPWNLGNVFGVQGAGEEGGGAERRVRGVERGQVLKNYRSGRGGIVVFDDGDIEEEMGEEREAYCALEGMPELGDADEESGSDTESEGGGGVPIEGGSRKRKSWDDRDVEDVGENGDERPRRRRRTGSDTGSEGFSGVPIEGGSRKRKSRDDRDVEDVSENGDERPRRRQRIGSVSSEASFTRDHEPRDFMTVSNHPTASSSAVRALSSPLRSQSPPPPAQQPSVRTLRRRLLRLRRKHEAVLRAYYSLGTSYSEPVSSIIYSLASDLGREDNDLLWYTIVGVSSNDLYGRTSTGVSLPVSSSPGWEGNRGERIRQTLRDEVRRLNPPELTPTGRSLDRSSTSAVIPTTARSATDTSIRLSPEPALLLIRHWSLEDSMLHSPYLSARLHVWSDTGRKRLHKLLAKMGISLSQCRQRYTHMDVDLKRGLRERLLRFAPVYGLEGLVPPAGAGGGGGSMAGWGFVRSWGWKACLSAEDVAVILGAILEVGGGWDTSTASDGQYQYQSHAGRYLPTPPRSADTADPDDLLRAQKEDLTIRFYAAYDALLGVSRLIAHLPTAMHLHRAILRTGAALLSKHQIRHLRAFRMGIVKEGPDVALFAHPGALVKLALWVGAAVEEMSGAGGGGGKRGTPMVLGCVDEGRRVCVVVGTGGGAGPGEGFVGKRSERKREKSRREREGRREERRKEKEARREERRKAREGDGGDGSDSEEEEEELGEDSSEDESDAEEEAAPQTRRRGYGRNRFGNAFQEVVEETNARVRIDSFEHCVVEVRKEDLGRFLESLSAKAVVG